MSPAAHLGPPPLPPGSLQWAEPSEGSSRPRHSMSSDPGARHNTLPPITLQHPSHQHTAHHNPPPMQRSQSYSYPAAAQTYAAYTEQDEYAAYQAHAARSCT